ncbi:hypothetical protein BHE74_00037836 [Ensete ventricosum]|nr:hypothetical protein BHE74_00037836 [Ensete ventricosum]RZS11480.1 hypothetical protein BHM03_00042826 [Ensete ventricosum]
MGKQTSWSQDPSEVLKNLTMLLDKAQPTKPGLARPRHGLEGGRVARARVGAASLGLGNLHYFRSTSHRSVLRSPNRIQRIRSKYPRQCGGIETPNDPLETAGTGGFAVHGDVYGGGEGGTVFHLRGVASNGATNESIRDSWTWTQMEVVSVFIESGPDSVLDQLTDY